MPRIRALLGLLRTQKLNHPKMPRIKRLVENKMKIDPDCRIIIFTNYRDTMSAVLDELNTMSEIKAEGFFGQARKGGEGLSQKEQVARLQRFKDGDCNVLVATSVGEEGLDVPSADLVIFHEPVASEIRTIQRRGRTARHREGQVVVLVAEDTRDEGIRHAAAAREAKMHRVLTKVRRSLLRAKVDDSAETRLQHFTILSVGSKTLKAATWMLNEIERLAPNLKEKEIIVEKAASLPKSRPGVRPEQLRPRQQMSIDAFMPQPDAKQFTPTSGDEWSNPILDGSRRADDETDHQD